MALQKVISIVDRLEDPGNPLLGPNIRGMRFFGIWPSNKYYDAIFNVIHIVSVIFVVTMLIELSMVIKTDFYQALLNMSITMVSIVTVCKTSSIRLRQKQWIEFFARISEEEIVQAAKNDRMINEIMTQYTKYARIMTYSFWCLVTVTQIVTISTPVIKYLSPSSNEELGVVEPYPQILSSWFPFDNTVMPGYVFGVILHFYMSVQGAGVIANYDAMAVSMFAFFKGQLMILRMKCRMIFQRNGSNKRDSFERIKECHRHHTFLVEQCKQFNTFISPVMFIYVLVCSVSICASVIQLSSDGATASQKLWVFEYTVALICQLFLYCWHCNEVTVESLFVDRGIFESDWWMGDAFLNRHIVILAAKLDRPLKLKAGPFNQLSIQLFIEIIKKSYSFYTLFAQRL